MPAGSVRAGEFSEEVLARACDSGPDGADWAAAYGCGFLVGEADELGEDERRASPRFERREQVCERDLVVGRLHCLGSQVEPLVVSTGALDGSDVVGGGAAGDGEQPGARGRADVEARQRGPGA